ANGNGLYERFTFYGSPLLAIAFVHAIEHAGALQRRLPYALLAYAAAAAAILLPLTSRLFDNLGHSPTLLCLSDWLVVRLHSPPLLWAPLLALLAIVAAGAGARRGYLLAGLAAGV